MSKASQCGWGCATVDVKTAFLQSLRREEKGKLTLVTPLAITKEVKVCGQEWWLVKGVMGWWKVLESGQSSVMPRARLYLER